MVEESNAPDYPRSIGTKDLLEPVPRRIRGVLAGRTVLDTVSAVYVWEIAHYPQYYVPLADIDASALVDEGHDQKLRRGTARRHGLVVGDTSRPGVLRAYGDDAMPGLAGMAHIDWSALDAWFEEDEQVFVHPRSPYTRVDALRSTRHLRVELDGVLLAESAAPVMVFETGLPTRYYVGRTEVDDAHLRPSDTVSECPYKGKTTGYWSAQLGDRTVADVAWTYAFPTIALAPIAGLVAFFNEKVDLRLDDTLLPRPQTRYSSAGR